MQNEDFNEQNANIEIPCLGPSEIMKALKGMNWDKANEDDLSIC